MALESVNRSPLEVVREDQSGQPSKVFCGHCGRSPEDKDGPEAGARVCTKCGMGLMLQAPATIAPKSSDPFMVVDGSLTICALSREAEKLLGISETDAVNRHVGEFLVPGDAESSRGENLASILAFAARGEASDSNVVVRPANTFGVRYWARVGPCGPPTAALLVLADAR